jgi:hypothetical protein
MKTTTNQCTFIYESFGPLDYISTYKSIGLWFKKVTLVVERIILLGENT